MAYELHYYSEFADDWEKKYRVEIHERDYSGDTLEVTSGGNPFLLEMVEVDNIFTPIRPKKVSIEWTSEIGSAFEIEDLFITDDRKYILYLYKYSEDEEDLIKIFSGYLVTVDCEEPFHSKPYHVQLAGICSLSFLKDQYFLGYSGEFTIERISIKDIIGQCLYASGLNLDYHVYVDMHEIQMSEGADWLLETEIDADGLRGLTCYEALEGALNSFNAFIVQDENAWVIKGIPDSNSRLCRVRKYNSTGVSLGTSIVNQAASIGREEFNSTTPHLIPTADVVKKLADISSIVKTTISPGIAVNRLENGQFAKPITGGNLVGWDITLNAMDYPSGGLESRGWTRAGFGTPDDPYRFEIRGTEKLGAFFDQHIDTKVPITIDAGLFDKDQKIKVVVSGAFRSRDISQMNIECRINDGDRDYVDWLNENGKWEHLKKGRAAIIIKADTNNITDISIPVTELPLQTFEVKSDIITNYLNRSVDGLPHSIAKIYFRIFPGGVLKDPGKAPLLSLEDFAVCITTESIYEGEHTYVVDADLPIRNANEIVSKAIIADKINIITPEQVRLTNRVMTGYSTLASTSNLTYAWKRNIGGLPDPTSDNWIPLQYKTAKERIRQLCGKRVVLEGSFLGYDLNSSAVVFSSYDSVGVPQIFYSITSWKWDVKQREYNIRINELSIEPLSNDQEFVELSKDGSSTRGNRLYTSNSGGSTSGNGNGSANPIEPITLDPIDPLYFVTNTTTTQSFDLGSYITSAQLPEDLIASIVYYPSWMLAPYEDRGVDGDLLTYTVTGTPLQIGHEQIVIELIGEEQQKYLAVIPIIMQPKTTNVNQVLDGTTLDILGVVPGFFPLPDLFNFRSKIVGTHDKIDITVIGGGVSGGFLNETTTREVELTDAANYLLFDTIDGVVVEAGVYNYEVVTYRGTLETSREEGSFTLYDEEYLAKYSAEFIDNASSEILGVINIDGSSSFTQIEGWDVKSIIDDLNHDKIHFTLKKDGIEVYNNEYIVADTLTGEYNLFDSVQTTYGSGDYELLVDVSLDGAAVYQRLVTFSVSKEDLKPQAGLELIEFTPNTTNYTVTQELPLFNAEYDLPENWGVKIPVPSIDYDYVEWSLFDSTSGALANVNIEAYTNYPQYKEYTNDSDKEDILIFGLKSSLDIGDIHRDPSSFRVISTFRIGGATGDIVGIRQSDFAFRVPLQPEDYSGTRFINIHQTTGVVTVIDENMPKLGRKYLLPELPLFWSVSVLEYDGSLFDKVIVKLSKEISGLYTPLHWLTGDIVLTYNSPTDVTELASDDLAYVIGISNPDDTRYLLDSSSDHILIDEIGKYKATFEFYLDSVLLGDKITEFELIDETVTDIPIKDCCGGSDGDLPVYPVDGIWGGDNQILKITLTENGTISAIEEENLDGISISDDVWEFTYPPRSTTSATTDDELVNYAQLTAAVAAGSSDKTPVKTVATSNITLSGNQTINGYNTVTGDRVLVTNQTDAKQNGSYVSVAGAWARSTDADTGAELLGATYLVTNGNASVIGTRWKVVNTPPIVIGTDNINIVQIQGAETDPTVGSWIKAITTTQISNWDNAYTIANNFNGLFDTRFNSKTTTNLSEGSNLYFTEARVRATVLTGLSSSDSSAVVASDSILVAIGKLQAKIANGVISGTTNKLLKFTSSNTAGDSIVTESFSRITVGGDVYSTSFVVNAPTSASVATGFGINNASSIRWFIGSLGAESGGNSGANLIVSRFGDSGFLGDVIIINRATGISTFNQVVVGQTPTASNHLTTKSYVDAGDVNGNTAFGWGNHASAGYVPSTRTITINGTTLDLSANRSWTISSGISGTINKLPYYNTATSLADSIVTQGFLRITVAGDVYGTGFNVNAPVSASVAVGFGINNVDAPRWFLGSRGAESTGNIGSDLLLSRFGTSGFLGDVFTINRASGIFTFNQVTIGVTPTATNHLATKGYIDGLITGKIAGSGTINYLPYFSSASTLANSHIYQETDYVNVTKFLRVGYSGANMFGSIETNTAFATLYLQNNSATNGLAITYDNSAQSVIFLMNTSSSGLQNALKISPNKSVTLYTASGISPFNIPFPTFVTNLHADLLDTYHATDLLSRSNHTGTQAISTITGLQTSLDGKLTGTGTYAKLAMYNVGGTTLTDSIITQGFQRVTVDGNVFGYGFTMQVTPSASILQGFALNTPTAPRWLLGMIGSESGSDLGSDLLLARFGTSGFLGNVFSIQRATGITTFNQVVVGQNPTATNHLTTKAYVDGAVTNGNTAFSWGNHASAGYATTTYVNTSVAGKENAFAKGNIIQGASIILSGTLTNRLVGAGDIGIAIGSLTIYNITDLPGTLNSLQVQINGKASTSTTDSLQAQINNRATISTTDSLQAQINNKMPIDRTITINGDTRYINDNPSFTISSSGGTITGGGTANYITKWTGGTSIGNSRIQDFGSGEIAFNAGISATHIFIDNTVSAGSGSFGSLNASILQATSRFSLPVSSEAGLPSSPPEGTIQYVNSGTGKGLWCYMGTSGWRLMATRLWVGGTFGGTSPP